MELEKLKYPIGPFNLPENILEADRLNWAKTLVALPGILESVIAPLNKDQMNTPYRPGGWTVRQVIHHLADSHMNAFCRIKLTLTEDSPTIKPYDEAAWAEMSDYTNVPIAASLDILRGLHKRMAHVLKNLSMDERTKYYVHPEYGSQYTLDHVLGLYAWHCNHHLAHITQLIKRNQW